MKISKLLLIFIFVLFSVSGFSQGFYFHAGMSHSWVTYKDSEIEKQFTTEFKPGFTFAFFYKNNLNDGFYLNSGLRYFSIGQIATIHQKENFFEDIDATIEISGNATLDHYYFSIPLQFGYNLTDYFSFYVNVEPALNMKTSESVKLTATLDYTNNDEHIHQEQFLNIGRNLTSNMNKFNLFSGIGARYLFELDKMKMALSSQMNFGLLRIPKTGEQTIEEGLSAEFPDWRVKDISIAVEIFF